MSDGTETIFLLGPPGAGKTTVGVETCRRLGLVFAELTSAAPLQVTRGNVWRSPGDVVELSWGLQSDNTALQLARQLGHTVLLWAHPETMTARARQPVVLTPRPGLSTRGGFGRKGTSALEFRRLDRGCHQTLMVEGLSVSEAAAALIALIEERRHPGAGAADRDDLARELEESWGMGTTFDTRPLALAMAEFIATRVASGASRRALRALWSDLQVAGLVYFHSWRAGNNALDDFRRGLAGDRVDFRRRVSDSPAQLARYLEVLEDFERFLDRRGQGDPDSRM